MKFAQLTQPLRKWSECRIAAKKKEGKLLRNRLLLSPVTLRATDSSILSHDLRLASYRRSLQQGSKRQLDSHRVLNTRHQSPCQQRMSTQVEKVISNPDRLRVEHRFPNRNQFFFSGIHWNNCLLCSVRGRVLFGLPDMFPRYLRYPYFEPACSHQTRHRLLRVHALA